MTPENIQGQRINLGDGDEVEIELVDEDSGFSTLWLRLVRLQNSGRQHVNALWTDRWATKTVDETSACEPEGDGPFYLEISPDSKLVINPDPTVADKEAPNDDQDPHKLAKRIAIGTAIASVAAGATVVGLKITHKYKK